MNVKLKKNVVISKTWPNIWDSCNQPEFQECAWCICICCCCMPLVTGFFHVSYDKEPDGTSCICCETCMLPVLCCCVGSAINRMRIGWRVGIESSFIVNLIMHSTVVCTPCLLFQENVALEEFKSSHSKK